MRVVMFVFDCNANYKFDNIVESNYNCINCIEKHLAFTDFIIRCRD